MDSNYRYFSSNAIPDHKYGPFPNNYNPNKVSSQRLENKVTLSPEFSSEGNTSLKLIPHGIFLNGVPLDSWAQNVIMSPMDNVMI